MYVHLNSYNSVATPNHHISRSSPGRPRFFLPILGIFRRRWPFLVTRCGEQQYGARAMAPSGNLATGTSCKARPPSRFREETAVVPRWGPFLARFVFGSIGVMVCVCSHSQPYTQADITSYLSIILFLPLFPHNNNVVNLVATFPINKYTDGCQQKRLYEE